MLLSFLNPPEFEKLNRVGAAEALPVAQVSLHSDRR